MSEYTVEKPKKIAQTISPEEIAEMEPIDKLVQVVVPRLIDKVNELAWENGKIKHEMNELAEVVKSFSLDAVNARIEAVEILAKGAATPEPVKTTRTRKKQEREKPTYVPEAQFAVYDPDTDTWKPREVCGKKITGSLIDTIKGLSGAATGVYDPELIEYVRSLDEDIVKAIKDKFPIE